MKYNKKLITKLSSAGAIFGALILGAGSCGDKKTDAPTPAATTDQGASQSAVMKLVEANDRKDKKNELKEIADSLTKKIDTILCASIAIPIPDGEGGTYTADNKKAIDALFVDDADKIPAAAKFDRVVVEIKNAYKDLLNYTMGKATEFKKTDDAGGVAGTALVKTTDGLNVVKAQGFDNADKAIANMNSRPAFSKVCKELEKSVVYIGKGGKQGRLFPKKVVCDNGFHSAVSGTPGGVNNYVNLTESLGIVLGASKSVSGYALATPIEFDLSNSPQCHENVGKALFEDFEEHYLKFRAVLSEIPEKIELQQPIDEQYVARLKKAYEEFYKPYIGGDERIVKGPLNALYTDKFGTDPEYNGVGKTIAKINNTEWKKNPKLKNAPLSGFKIVKDGCIDKAIKRQHASGKKELDKIVRMCEIYQKSLTALHGNTTGEQPSEKPKAEKKDKKKEGSEAGKKGKK